MANKSWRELTKGQKEDAKRRFRSPYERFDGNPYYYIVENGKVQRRHLKYTLEERREMRQLMRNPFRD